MKLSQLFRWLLVLALAGVSAAVVRAEDLGTVKARMEQRVGAIDAMKGRGVVGENNRGYLEARGAVGAEDEKIISDENSDRRAVYVGLAQQTGSDADTVGRRRAHQIALYSKRGVWIQSPSGEWTQKG